MVAREAAFAQGFVSFSITFVITALMEGLCKTAGNALASFLLAAGGGIALAATYTIGMHLWVGTPEIWVTVAPSLTIGSSYCIVYSARLARSLRAEPSVAT